MRRERNFAVLPQTDNPEFTPTLGTSTELAIALLTHYSFDLGGYTATEIVNNWQNQYPEIWLHLAVVEALYQGRYKAVSVQQILTLWSRRGQVSFHFNMEFERLICSKFPVSLTSDSTPSQTPPQTPTPAKTSIHFQKFKQQEKQREAEKSQNTFPTSHKVQQFLPFSTSKEVESNFELKSSSQILSEELPSSTPPQSSKPLLASVTSHPPIEQFTPESSDRSESFTEKLKAISTDKSRE